MMIQAINGKNGGGEVDMPTVRSKPGPGRPSRKEQAHIFRLVIPVAFFVLIWGSGHAGAELPALNSTAATTFRGEIAKGLKIEMRLYQDGSSLHGVYSY